MLNEYYVIVDNNLMQVIDKLQKLPEYWKNISHLHNFSDEELKNLSWAGHPNLGWICINSNLIKNYKSTPENLELNKNHLKTIISEKRWEKENTPLEINGIKVIPNEKTRYSLWIKRIQALENPSIKVNYKILDKFYTLTSNQIVELCDRIEEYIQQCFDEEMRSYKQIEFFKQISDFTNLKYDI